MPLHTIFAEEGSTSGKTKAKIAVEITRVHAEVMKELRACHVSFYGMGRGYTAGEKAATAAVNCVLRDGHSAQEKNDMLKRIWSMFQQLTGVATEQLAISLQEIPASNALEMGQIMPAVEQA